jgi:hypothetical protein
MVNDINPNGITAVMRRVRFATIGLGGVVAVAWLGAHTAYRGTLQL